MFHNIKNISIKCPANKKRDKSLSMYTIKLPNKANRKSKAWEFFGILQLKTENKCIEDDKVYCKLCFDEQKKDDATIIFSTAKIQSYSRNCSTGNLIRHLNNVHNLRDIDSPSTSVTSAENSFGKSTSNRSPPNPIDTVLPKEEQFDFDDDLPLNSYSDAVIVETILTKEESIDYDHDLPISSYSAASFLQETEDPIKCSTESPTPKKRKADNTSQFTPFELAMLDIERDRTDRLEHLAKCRLDVMNKMAAENVDFHKKVLALMKSKK